MSFSLASAIISYFPRDTNNDATNNQYVTLKLLQMLAFQQWAIDSIPIILPHSVIDLTDIYNIQIFEIASLRTNPVTPLGPSP